jgi:EpsI family protein
MTDGSAAVQMTSRRSLVFGGLLGAAGLASLFGRGALDFAASDPAPIEPLIPERVGSWSNVGSGGLVLPSQVEKIRFYDQELERVYVSDDEPPMMLVMAYCARPQQGLLQLHDPRVCYPGAGFSITPGMSLAVNLDGPIAVEAQSFTATRPGRTEQVIYWTRVGEDIKSPEDDQHLTIIRSVVKGDVPDGLLFRVSSLGEGPGLMRQIQRFAAELVKAVPQPGRELILGRRLAATWPKAALARAR